MRKPNTLRRKEIPNRFVLISLLAFLGFALILAGCSNAPGAGNSNDEPEPIIEETFLLGTLVTVRVHEWDSDLDIESVIEQSLKVMEDAGNVVSVYHPESDISAVNSGGGQPITVSPEIFELLEIALEVSELTEGSLDPTIGPVVEAWGFYTDDRRIPDDDEIERALELVGHDRIEINKADRTVTISDGMKLDLEALAKGYAGRLAVEFLADQGVTSALISAGQSSIEALGDGPGGRAWRVGLLDPRQRDKVYAVVELYAGEALSTSGDTQRYFEVDGQRFSHILDPRTGWPAQTMQTITIVTSDSVVADALSTGLFVLEPTDALDRVEQMPDVEAILVTSDGEIMSTSGMDSRVTIQE